MALAYECFSEQRKVDDNESINGYSNERIEDGYLFIPVPKVNTNTQRKKQEQYFQWLYLQQKQFKEGAKFDTGGFHTMIHA